MRGNPQRNLVAFAMVFFAVCLPVDAQSETAKSLRFKLADYGWQSLPKSRPGERPSTHAPSVVIDHKGRILVGFAAHENTELTSREHPGLLFHILRFNPEGKLDHTLLVPTKQYYGNEVVSRSEGSTFCPRQRVLPNAVATKWRRNIQRRMAFTDSLSGNLCDHAITQPTDGNHS